MRALTLLAMALALVGAGCSSNDTAGYPEDDPVEYEAEEVSSDVPNAVSLSNEAAILLLDVDEIARTTAPGDECFAIAEIRFKVDRVWEIIGQLREMDLPSSMDEKLNEAVSSVTQVEADTLTVERMC